MPKKGSKRAKKFSVKHDPNLIMLRWKALRDWSITKFRQATERHATLDDNISQVFNTYILPYATRGNYMDKVRKIVYAWDSLTDYEKQVLKQDWIREGLPEELFDKIAFKHSEISLFMLKYDYNNIKLTFETEISPIPQETLFPLDEDSITKIYETPTTPETKPLYPIWKQTRTVYGKFYCLLQTWVITQEVLGLVSSDYEIQVIPPIQLDILAFARGQTTIETKDGTANITSSFDTAQARDGTANIILSYEIELF
jgi:hypothetical protein